MPDRKDKDPEQLAQHTTGDEALRGIPQGSGSHLLPNRTCTDAQHIPVATPKEWHQTKPLLTLQNGHGARDNQPEPTWQGWHHMAHAPKISMKTW